MNIVTPSNTTHTIRVIPRITPVGAMVFTIRNEFKNITYTPSNTYQITNGYLFVTFDFTTFVDRDRFQVTMTEGSSPSTDPVVYRGLLFATAQNTQEFKLSQGVYL